jgi:anthranilate phosphoribosyltransferase
VTDLLNGAGTQAARAAVALNAAAAVYVAGKAQTYSDAMELAQRALDSGAGARALEKMRSAYHAGTTDAQ